MDTIILYSACALSVVVLFYVLKIFPKKDLLLVFLFTAYFGNIIGTFVVKFNLINYLKMGSYINSGQFFELIVFPTIVMYFYKTSYHVNTLNAFFQSVMYSAGLTILEVILERNTGLIHYINWNWMYTFVSVFVFMLAVRFMVTCININMKN